MNVGVELALLVPVAYLLGTFPSAALVARRRGVDVTAEGSGNPGASNTFRLLGWKAGALVFALDVLKGAVAAGVGLAVDGHRGAYILGVAAILGHMLPVTRRFKGGRGVATGGGVMLVIFPLLTLAMAVLWVVLAQAHAQGVDRVGDRGHRVPDLGRARGSRAGRRPDHHGAGAARGRPSPLEPAPAREGRGARARAARRSPTIRPTSATSAPRVDG